MQPLFGLFPLQLSCFSGASELCAQKLLDWWQWQLHFEYNSKMSKVLAVGSWPSFLLKPDFTAPMGLLQGLRHTECKEGSYYSKGFYFIGSTMLELQTEVTMKILCLLEMP